jgi:GTP diphosphokinase / guanosine-3',5'-bis(diphosphate) 3'-diphosphatase
MVVTGRAKSAIRRSLREEERATLVRLGREIARVALERVGKKATDKALDTAARRLGLEDAEELLARLGSAEIAAREVVRAIYPDLAHRPGDQVDEGRAVVGLSPDQSHKRAPCCQPVPGERIVGITFRGQASSCNPSDCPALVEFEDQPERLDRPALAFRHAPARAHCQPGPDHRQRRRRAWPDLHAHRRAEGQYLRSALC